MLIETLCQLKGTLGTEAEASVGLTLERGQVIK